MAFKPHDLIRTQLMEWKIHFLNGSKYTSPVIAALESCLASCDCYIHEINLRRQGDDEIGVELNVIDLSSRTVDFDEIVSTLKDVFDWVDITTYCIAETYGLYAEKSEPEQQKDDPAKL